MDSNWEIDTLTDKDITNMTTEVQELQDKITEDMMITLREVELGVTVDGEKFEGDVLPNEVFYFAQDRNGDSFVSLSGRYGKTRCKLHILSSGS